MKEQTGIGIMSLYLPNLPFDASRTLVAGIGHQECCRLAGTAATGAVAESDYAGVSILQERVAGVRRYVELTR